MCIEKQPIAGSLSLYSALVGFWVLLAAAGLLGSFEPYKKNCANKMVFNKAAIPNEDSTIKQHAR
jgi:hypothetical protein